MELLTWLFRDRNIPRIPPVHQRTPIMLKTGMKSVFQACKCGTYVCCMSFTDHVPPWCSVKVLTAYDPGMRNQGIVTIMVLANPLQGRLISDKSRQIDDTYPKSDDYRVKEFGTAPTSTNPLFANQKDDSHHDGVGNESAAHNIMRKALTWANVRVKVTQS